MRRAWKKRSFAVACALVVVGVAPLACWFGWSFYGNDSPVSMPVPLRQGTYSSPWFTTRIHDLYELDLGTIPWRQIPADINWKIIDSHGDSIAAGSWQDQTSGTTHIMLVRYYPKPGLRQRVIVNIPHDVTGSEAGLTVSLYCPEASLEGSYAIPIYGLWALVCLGIAVVLFLIPPALRLWHRSAPATS